MVVPLQSHIFFSYLLRLTLYFSCGVALSFNLTNIKPQNLNVDIIVDPDAYISTQGIQLTPDERSVQRERKAGRAMYIEPLHLWDKTSGNLTDFNTHFSFVIDSEGSLRYADGLTFFLTTPGDANITSGRFMGLPFDPITGNATSPFVAVEFDTFANVGQDPDNVTTHVGIDINSVTSSATQKWFSKIPLGVENEAWISYNSSSKILGVVFTGIIDNSTVQQRLDLFVDLREFLPEWVRIGFTAATGFFFQRNNVVSWQFSSSLRIDKKTAPSPESNGLIPEEKIGKRKGLGLAVGLAVGLLVSVLFLCLALLAFFVRKQRRKPIEHDGFSIRLSMEEDFEMGRGPKRFSFIDLSRATNNFNEKRKLGEGGFGGVYKGFLKELNSYVAVKRISKGSKQGIKEYAAEVKIISRLRHRNLVQLIGWCHENRELILVYEFMARGSLDTHLFEDKSLLTWGERFRIAKSLASALLYLHEEWEQCVVHRDVKSSNVMLDEKFNAKLGDFGLARLVDHEKGTQTTMLAGTMGYMAPECAVMGKTSKESDVYSFGIVALEIACGRNAIDISVKQSQVRLVEFVWNLYGGENLLDAVDPKLKMDFELEEVERLMMVGLWCAHPDHKLRPSIRQAIRVLNFEAPLPVLPRRMPVATYLSQPVNSSSSLVSSIGNTISASSQTVSSGYTYSTNSSKVRSSSSRSSPSTSIVHTS